MTVAIARSLSKQRIPVICGHFGARAPSAGSNAVSANIRLPDDPADLHNHLRDIIDRKHVDTLLPCSDKAIRAILPYYTSLKTQVALSIPPPEIVEKVLNKEHALRLAERCGLRIPKTFSIPGRDDLLEKGPELQFPLIAKPSKAGIPHAFKTEFFRSLSDLSFAFERDPLFGIDIMFQEFIPGEGVGLSTIVFRGAPLALFQHKRIHEWPSSGGVGVLTVSEPIESALAPVVTQLLQTIGWEGPAMVEFRRNKQTGEYVFLEVNGRFWGSLPLAIQAGLDFPYFEWQILHAIVPSVPVNYKCGLHVRWTAGEIQRLQELFTDVSVRKRTGVTRLTALRQFVESFSPRVRSALFNLADPKPAILEVFMAFRSMSGSILRAMLPGSIRRRYRQYRQLDKRYQNTYLQLWFMRALGLRKVRRTRRLSHVSSVILVCRGNRIRSPFAAALLTTALQDDQSKIHIVSAGTHVTPGSRTDPRIIKVALDLGIPIAGEAQNITEELGRNADLIIVMDYTIEAEVVTRFPHLKKKVFLLRELTPSPGIDFEILDPDKEPEQEFSRSIETIREAASQLSYVLSTEKAERGSRCSSSR